jgi:hypothetical protein
MRPNSLQSLFAILFFVVAGLTSPQLVADNLRYELIESSRSIMRVGPNQTLDQLVEQVYAGHKELWPQIKRKIRELNPHAFNRYTDQLVVGQRLKLVTVKKIHELGYVTHLNEVGKTSRVQGIVVVTDKEGGTKSLQKSSPIYEGDRITTEKGSYAIITMIDGAEMRIRPDSSLRITEYVMKSGFERGSRSIIDLIKGGLRKITGAIAANPLSVYRMNSGIITIGVRGTDYIVKLCHENDCSQSAGRNDAGSRLHIVVLDGVITLEDEEGVQGELALGQYAIADQEKVVMVEESMKPVPGLLEQEEQEVFDKAQPPEKEEEGSIWPWLLGGALFGI